MLSSIGIEQKIVLDAKFVGKNTQCESEIELIQMFHQAAR
jgi:hypothetical protein